MRFFTVGDEVFYFEERDKNKNGIRIRAEKSTICKIVYDETLSKTQGDFRGYVLANGTFSKDKDLYTKAGFEQKIKEFLEEKTNA
jgi:hypothetical protein